MSEIKALNELRILANNNKQYWWSHMLLEYLDSAQAEIADNYTRLPVDIDGVPIHVGDDLRSAYSKTEYKALGFWFDFDCSIWQVMVSSKQAMSGNMLRHVLPRTLEDVLREFAENAVCCNQFGSLYADEKRIAECADEIRELLGGEGDK